MNKPNPKLADYTKPPYPILKKTKEGSGSETIQKVNGDFDKNIG